MDIDFDGVSSSPGRIIDKFPLPAKPKAGLLAYILIYMDKNFYRLDFESKKEIFARCISFYNSVLGSSTTYIRNTDGKVTGQLINRHPREALIGMWKAQYRLSDDQFKNIWDELAREGFYQPEFEKEYAAKLKAAFPSDFFKNG